jgi:hypothetical protein
VPCLPVDSRARGRVARSAFLLVLASACGGGAQQLPDDKPLIAEGGAEPRPVKAAPRGAKATPVEKKEAPKPVRQALVGEMCLDRGGGRPALALLLTRQVGWGNDPRELAHLASRMGARPFAVLSARGTRAGVFQAVGPVDLGTESPALTGGYAGKGPCEDAEAAFAAACSEAQAKCGLAVAALGVDGADEAPKLRAGGACLEKDGLLLVDIDGDGMAEAFPAAGFLDEVKAPANEVAAAPAAGAKSTCIPAFSLPKLVRGKDVKAFRALDLLGVVDLDDDGRFELVLQYRYASLRTWGVYAADPSLARLTLVGEVTPWAAE